MKRLSLVAKFNIVFILIFLIGFGAASFIANMLLKDYARDSTLESARVLMQSATAARSYTVAQLAPLLQSQMKFTFLPQTVPSYAATEHLNLLLKTNADFSYKEATLNPTNPRDRATDWEADLVRALRDKPALGELVGQRESAVGPALYIARPLQIKDGACLSCHSVPEAAPKTMLDIYGPNNGFGWKLNEIIGAQVVSVPMAVPLQRANVMLKTFMLSMLGLFVFLFIALNVMVQVFVTRRITQMAAIADQVSLGQFEAAEMDTSGKDELSALALSFGRMRTSLTSAMKMLED
jgi:HAMP domain-containing protein